MNAHQDLWLVTEDSVLSPQQLAEGQRALDDVVEELAISSPTALGIGADLVIRLLIDGSYNAEQLRAALRRFLSQLEAVRQ